MDQDTFSQLVVPGVLTGCVGVIGWAIKRLIDRIDELEDDSQACLLRTSELRGHVSEHYAKKTDVQHSLDRIHTRLDSLPGEIIKAIRRDA